MLTFHVGAAWDEDRMRVGQFQERLIDGTAAHAGSARRRIRQLPPGDRRDAALAGRGRRAVSETEANGVLTVGHADRDRRLPERAVDSAGGRGMVPRRLRGPAGAARAMVNRRFVDRFAAGRTWSAASCRSPSSSRAVLIAGIVGDVLEDGPAAPAVPYVYTCLPLGSWPDPEYVVRAEGDPRPLPAIDPAIVKIARSRAAGLRREAAGRRDGRGARSAAAERPRWSTFAAAALVLAALGLYGLLTLLVAERRRELGVRMALGASPRDLVEVVVAGAGRLVIGGDCAGVCLLLGAGCLLRALLFGVTPYDPRALAWSVGALALVALVAVIVPARQAARVSAMEAMKNRPDAIDVAFFQDAVRPPR